MAEQIALNIDAVQQLPPDDLRKREKAKKWWQSAQTKFGMRSMQLVALVKAIFIFLSESKTAMAAFDAIVKLLASETHSPQSWTANVTQAIVAALKAEAEPLVTNATVLDAQL